MSFELRSPAFRDYGLLPDRYLRTSPPLEWTEPPGGTRSLALIAEKRPKLHAPWSETLEGDPETYWLAWGLPPRAGKLDAGVSLLREGTGTAGRVGYAVEPPLEKGHRRVIVFRLVALSEEIELPRGAGRMELLQACAGLVLDEADLEVIEEPGRPRIFELLRRLVG